MELYQVGGECSEVSALTWDRAKLLQKACRALLHCAQHH
jgi:hypothetical protein